MERKFAFVDESGNHDLDTSKSGSSDFFVVCSIIVPESSLEMCKGLAEAARSRHFQQGEIKSSNVRAKDAERRRRILVDLAQLPLKLYVIVVDKARVYRDGGLQFKKSFIKHANGLLYQRLFHHYSNLNVIADEHGTPEFQESLKSYVESRYANDLFGHAEFETKSSKDDVLIQVADFFAGTVAQIYEGKATSEIEEIYKNILRNLTLGVLEWPPKYQSFLPPPIDDSDYADYRVHQEALKQADQFVSKIGSHPDEDERLQLCILDYLRFRSDFSDQSEYISTIEIVDHLNKRGFNGLTEQKIRSSGIAKLRDADVIIASGAKGYKIPQSRADINDFLNLASSQVVPLLERIKKARDVYMLSSMGEYDILKAANLPELTKLLASLEAFGTD